MTGETVPPPFLAARDRDERVGQEPAISARRRPAISIVIPAHNVAAYIADAVRSALAQTGVEIEVIAVDDGSTDATPRILAALAASDPRLRVVTQPNGGLSAARNTGVRHARAELIGFLDGDDLWMPEKAARHVDAMRHDATIGISFSHSAYIDETGARTGRILRAASAAPSLHAMIRRNHVGNGSTPVVRRRCFEVAGLFRPELRSCEDYEAWCRILCLTDSRAVLVDDVLTAYRIRRSSLSFDTAAFTRNADLAMRCLRATMPSVPARVLHAATAEHYRIAAWKAVTAGRRDTARRLLIEAVRHRPLLLLRSRRAFAAVVAILLPRAVLAPLLGGARPRSVPTIAARA